MKEQESYEERLLKTAFSLNQVFDIQNHLLQKIYSNIAEAFGRINAESYNESSLKVIHNQDLEDFIFETILFIAESQKLHDLQIATTQAAEARKDFLQIYLNDAKNKPNVR